MIVLRGKDTADIGVVLIGGYSSGQTCGKYMSDYISSVGGAILVAFITAKQLGR